MTFTDYIVITVYLLFVFSIGPIYKRFSSTASDYFRGGGGMLWWMVGASAWMMGFSAWLFTGGAGKVYDTGIFYLLLTGANVIALLVTYFVTAPWFRQMRVITGIEAVRDRFGAANEQFFAWLPVPFGILFGGIGLYAIAIFMYSVLGLDQATLIITLGVVVTLMSLIGGSWAVVASDFVQMLLVLTITLVMSYLALTASAVGGLTGLLHQLPASHLDLTVTDRSSVLWVFLLMLVINQTVQMNSMVSNASKFILCKTGKDAKRALLISLFGTILFTPIFIIPALTARIVHPEIKLLGELKQHISSFETSQNTKITSLEELKTIVANRPNAELAGIVAEAQRLDVSLDHPLLKLNNPSEGAYVWMAMRILPEGMLGLLVCGIFAATMTTMDGGLNRAAGIFVRNCYIVYLDKKADERRQILAGRITTAVYGALQIVVGIIFIQNQTPPLFDLILFLAALVGMPIAIPLFFGMFVKRTPPWAGWTTVLVGFFSGIGLQFLLTPERMPQLMSRLGWTDLNGNELNDLKIAITTGVVFVFSLAWFGGTIPFAASNSREHNRRVDDFFTRMRTPINVVAEGVAGWEADRKHYQVMGVLCLSFGGFVLLLMFLPNPLWGRLCFLFCGGSIALTGGWLYSIALERGWQFAGVTLAGGSALAVALATTLTGWPRNIWLICSPCLLGLGVILLANHMRHSRPKTQKPSALKSGHGVQDPADRLQG